ncbi:hypothetical protein GOC16_17890 [Sinorhizobium meliloti]|nr:hypothetical protein [Sinorhizobium meliloti]
MAITFPRDILASFPGWSPRFELLFRQEQSRQASGRTIVKDLGSPLWQADYQSRTMRPNELDRWRAILDSLDGGIQQFLGYSLSRCYPTSYPNGSWPAGSFTGSNANLHTIGANNKSVRVSALAPGFRFKAGDMIRIGSRDLHRVQEDVTADGAGLTPIFEVRPHLWPGTVTGTAVSVVRPHCYMTVVPGSINTDADMATGRGSVSFSAIESR